LKLLYDLGFIDSEDKHPEKSYSLKVKELRKFFDIYDKVVEKMKNI
jgi:hypothetical protein